MCIIVEEGVIKEILNVYLREKKILNFQILIKTIDETIILSSLLNKQMKLLLSDKGSYLVVLYERSLPLIFPATEKHQLNKFLPLSSLVKKERRKNGQSDLGWGFWLMVHYRHYRCLPPPLVQ